MLKIHFFGAYTSEQKMITFARLRFLFNLNVTSVGILYPVKSYLLD
jgi:hypothetical protein